MPPFRLLNCKVGMNVFALAFRFFDSARSFLLTGRLLFCFWPVCVFVHGWQARWNALRWVASLKSKRTSEKFLSSSSNTIQGIGNAHLLAPSALEAGFKKSCCSFFVWSFTWWGFYFNYCRFLSLHMPCFMRLNKREQNDAAWILTKNSKRSWTKDSIQNARARIPIDTGLQDSDTFWCSCLKMELTFLRVVLCYGPFLEPPLRVYLLAGDNTEAEMFLLNLSPKPFQLSWPFVLLEDQMFCLFVITFGQKCCQCLRLCPTLLNSVVWRLSVRHFEATPVKPRALTNYAGTKSHETFMFDTYCCWIKKSRRMSLRSKLFAGNLVSQDTMKAVQISSFLVAEWHVLHWLSFVKMFPAVYD